MGTLGLASRAWEGFQLSPPPPSRRLGDLVQSATCATACGGSGVPARQVRLLGEAGTALPGDSPRYAVRTRPVSPLGASLGRTPRPVLEAGVPPGWHRSLTRRIGHPPAARGCRDPASSRLWQGRLSFRRRSQAVVQSERSGTLARLGGGEGKSSEKREA